MINVELGKREKELIVFIPQQTTNNQFNQYIVLTKS